MKFPYLLFLSFLLFNCSLFAQKKETYFHFYGDVRLEHEKGKKVTVSLYDGNELVSSFVTGWKGRFAVDVSSDKHYTLVFEKEGFVSKSVIIDTRDLPEKQIIQGGFAFDINLIKKEEGINYALMDFPITLISYHKRGRSLEYNKNYTLKMLIIQNEVIADGTLSPRY